MYYHPCVKGGYKKKVVRTVGKGLSKVFIYDEETVVVNLRLVTPLLSPFLVWKEIPMKVLQQV